MLTVLVAIEESTPIIPDEPSERAVWAIVAAVILGLYFFMKTRRRKAAEDYWARRQAEKDRIANDPDMRKDYGNGS